MKEYKVIGLMSGTSLDGLDIAYCRFIYNNGNWDYSILDAETISYSGEWTTLLSGLHRATAAEFSSADHRYGHLAGRLVRDFMNKKGIHPDFVASHGHTVFHQPAKGYTAQIGNGAAIRSEINIPVICDFRSGDVAKGGQGAPLVPAGDRLLFAGYDYCLNLGGFANISYEQDGNRIAFDICPVNIVLNSLAMKTGRPFDMDGRLAASGKVSMPLLEKLNSLPFYKKTGPRSLGKEWVEETISPLLCGTGISTEDILSTFCTHIAQQISRHTGTETAKKVLVTGGGANNIHLVSQLKAEVRPQIIIPDTLTVNFKEALIFAFLGVLRWRGETNCLRTVTGAKTDTSSGAIY